jgi:hypothetical protein
MFYISLPAIEIADIFQASCQDKNQDAYALFVTFLETNV